MRSVTSRKENTMKYFKIYHRNCTVSKAYVPVTWEEFCDELNSYAEERLPDLENEDGSLDYEGMEIEMDALYQEAEQETVYDGLDCGDFHLYKRRDDFDMYDIARE